MRVLQEPSVLTVQMQAQLHSFRDELAVLNSRPAWMETLAEALWDPGSVLQGLKSTLQLPRRVLWAPMNGTQNECWWVRIRTKACSTPWEKLVRYWEKGIVTKKWWSLTIPLPATCPLFPCVGTKPEPGQSLLLTGNYFHFQIHSGR